MSYFMELVRTCTSPLTALDHAKVERGSPVEVQLKTVVLGWMVVWFNGGTVITGATVVKKSFVSTTRTH